MWEPLPVGVDGGPGGGGQAAAMLTLLCDAGAEVRVCACTRLFGSCEGLPCFALVA